MKEDKHRLWQIIVSMVSSILVLTGIFIGVNHFDKEQHNKTEYEKKQDAARMEEHNIQLKNAFQENFFERQLEFYIEVTRSTGRLTQYSIGTNEYKNARVNFYELYWGPMSIVEDEKVKMEMEKFSRLLMQYENDPSLADNYIALQQGSYQLAQQCRLSTNKSWQLTQIQ